MLLNPHLVGLRAACDLLTTPFSSLAFLSQRRLFSYISDSLFPAAAVASSSSLSASVLFLFPHRGRNPPHVQAFHTVSELMSPLRPFSPGVSAAPQAHDPPSTDTTTWVSNKNPEFLSRTGFLTAPNPPPAVFPPQERPIFPSSFQRKTLQLPQLSHFSCTPCPIFRISCWFSPQERSRI